MKLLLPLLSCFAAVSAEAHVVLAEPAAPAGSYYRATFRVGHGCDGSATTAISVSIPDGVVGAKPMAKPGWTVETRTEKSTRAQAGKPAAVEVREITWRGGPLPDAHYDEFVAMMKLPATAGKRWFKITQTCEKGSTAWADVPEEGKSTRDLKTPAALLDVLPAAAADGGHAH